MYHVVVHVQDVVAEKITNRIVIKKNYKMSKFLEIIKNLEPRVCVLLLVKLSIKRLVLRLNSSSEQSLYEPVACNDISRVFVALHDVEPHAVLHELKILDHEAASNLSTEIQI